MPKDPVIMFEGLFEGGRADQQGRLHRRGARCRAGRRADGVLPEDRDRPPLRAVADDHQAAQSVGIPLNKTWVIVGAWRPGGPGGRHHLGLEDGRAVLARHRGAAALPVVILGGLTSVPGAIVGGLIIGVGEKLSEVYLGPSSAAASRSGSPT